MSVPRAFAVILVLLLLVSDRSEAGRVLPFDPYVPGFKVTRIMKDREAINAIHKLHRMTLDIVKGVIVEYEEERSVKTTVWASAANAQAKAQEQIDVMMDKMIVNKRSPFSGYRTWKLKSTPIIGFDGMGQTHRVFRIGMWVYWISGYEKGIDDIVAHILKGASEK